MSTNYQGVGVKSLNYTSLQCFVHASIQVIEVHEHACPILMCGSKVVFRDFPPSKLNQGYT